MNNIANELEKWGDLGNAIADGRVCTISKRVLEYNRNFGVILKGKESKDQNLFGDGEEMVQLKGVQLRNIYDAGMRRNAMDVLFPQQL